jgi:DNA-binding transcriptional LysR family regulator
MHEPPWEAAWTTISSAEVISRPSSVSALSHHGPRTKGIGMQSKTRLTSKPWQMPEVQAETTQRRNRIDNAADPHYNCNAPAVRIIMEDHRLRSYCLVVETRSFSRAAQAKHMTQSAMSRLVKGLENEMGVSLLHRKGKIAMPTPEGVLFYEYAKRILEDYRKMGQDVAAAAQSARGALRLGASRTAAAYLLPRLFYDFSKEHPDIRIDLSVGGNQQVLRDLHDRKIELGVLEGAVVDDAVHTEMIAEDEIVLIAPEDHPFAKRRKVTAQELAGEHFILPERGSGIRELVDYHLRDLKLDRRSVRVRMTIESPELVVQMVQAGLGIAFVSKWSVFAAVKEGTLKVVRTKGQGIKRRFALAYLGQVAAAPVVRTFREYLRNYRFFVPF